MLGKQTLAVLPSQRLWILGRPGPMLGAGPAGLWFQGAPLWWPRLLEFQARWIGAPCLDSLTELAT